MTRSVSFLPSWARSVVLVVVATAAFGAAPGCSDAPSSDAASRGFDDDADSDGADVVGDAFDHDSSSDGGDDARPRSAAILPRSFVHLDDGPLVAREGPAIAACGPGGLLAEGDALEIRTAFCDPADVTAPLPIDVVVGARVDLTLVHSALVADGGEAHFALFVGDEKVWDHATTLPAPAAFLAPDVVVQQAHPAGTPVVLHVHNHGSNTYTLVGLRFSSP